jgi:hypothetical protein|tara:strand:+ start:2266 stop:2538 length:273 start_codon:yes stop_codon:yes gene_type:complete
MSNERLADAVEVFAKKRGIEKSYTEVYALLRVVERAAEKLGVEAVSIAENMVIEPFGELADELLKTAKAVKDDPAILSGFWTAFRRAAEV